MTLQSLVRLKQLVVHRQLDTIPDSYTQGGRANPEQTISLSVGLASNNNTGLTERLYEVSMPNSTKYGQHLTKEEVDEHLRPNLNTTKAFNQWMSRHGIKPSATSSSGNHFTIELPVSKAEELLNTTFYHFDHTPSNQTLIRTKEYSVPSSLYEDILLLQPTTHIPPEPQPRRHRSMSGVSAVIPSNATTRRQYTCQQVVEPGCVQSQYGIPSNVGTSDKVGILSFIGQTVQGVSLAKYIGAFRPDVKLGTIDVEIISVDGGDNADPQSQHTTEANLDVQMVAGLMPSTKVKVITTASTHADGTLDNLDALNYLLSQSDPPPVVSMSYGLDETDMNLDSANAVCDAIKALGARGVTVVTASGDGGVSGGQARDCTTFNPTFPSSCPWTLSVGATNLTSGTEIAATFSSGGFSNIFPMESFQTDAFLNYQKQIGSLHAGLYNRSGSMFPVTAMVGVSIAIHDQKDFISEGGTSASAPIAAAVITAFNQIRANKGEPPLGFASPYMYSNPDLFNDITQGNIYARPMNNKTECSAGSNPGCNTNGFPALSGWDPVTGMGSIDYQKFAAKL